MKYYEQDLKKLNAAFESKGDYLSEIDVPIDRNSVNDLVAEGFIEINKYIDGTYELKQTSLARAYFRKTKENSHHVTFECILKFVVAPLFVGIVLFILSYNF